MRTSQLPSVTHRRAVGPLGTVARIVLGLILIATVVTGHFQPLAWTAGIVAFPAIVIAAHWIRLRRNPAHIEATGPIGFAVNLAVVLVLFLTPWYAPALAFTNNAAALFYGASMLLAAARGYAGCEVLALSNWLLRRDDQVGCLVFEPIDRLERARAARR
ncbi:MAG: hypothetical protein M3313_04660 [Actinomycetota bacterium]|nr:hypothetical protein [Actinomycetota bacterium]